MGLKITKQDFFNAYSDKNLTRPLFKHNNSVKVGQYSDVLKKQFSLSHKLFDAKELIKNEQNQDDKTRLFQIVDRIYAKEHSEHSGIVKIIFLFRNFLLGRGFCTEESLYKDIKNLERATSSLQGNIKVNKSKEPPQEKKDATLNESKEKPSNFQKGEPLSNRFKANFAVDIMPLTEKEIEQMVLKKEPPFDAFYSFTPDTQKLQYICKNLEMEQLTALSSSLFKEKSSVTERELINYIIGIKFEEKSVLDLIKQLDAKQFFPLTGWLNYHPKTQDSLEAAKIFAQTYISYALTNQEAKAQVLFNSLYKQEGPLCDEVLSNFNLDKLPHDQQMLFLKIAKGYSSLRETVLPKISPLFLDMDQARAVALFKASINDISKLNEIFSPLHHSFEDSAYFSRNFRELMKQLAHSSKEFKQLLEHNIFKLDQKCTDWKLGLIFSSLSMEQNKVLVEETKKKNPGSFIALANLASATSEKQIAQVLETYREDLGEIFAKAPEEELQEENISNFRLFLFDYIDYALKSEERDFWLDLLYNSNDQLFKCAIANVTEKLTQWAGEDPKRKQMLE